MVCIIAEKPSVGRDLARVVGATNKRDGYMEGGGYCVTWCFGHLIQLAMPQEYGFSWGKESLPMLPVEFKLAVKQEKKGDKYAPDAGALKQINTVKECISKSRSIVVATDAGREGELIFRYLYEYIKSSVPFKRLWISSLTDHAIKEGLTRLKEGSAYDNLYHAARCRSQADWLVGMNGTQAYSTQLKAMYSIGRVQTPTLMLICQRYLSHKEFVKAPFFKWIAACLKDAVPFKMESVNQWPSRESMPKMTINEGVITKLEKKKETSKSPSLYDLTELQKDANNKLGLTAEGTLNICQGLYEKKFITYPRTGSCYLTQDVYNELEKHTDSLPEEMKRLLPSPLNAAVVNEEKVTDHHAILVTEVKAQGLSEAEHGVYNLICVRMVEALCNNAKGERVNVTMECNHELFYASTIKYTELGWRAARIALKALAPSPKEEKEQEEEKEEKEVTLPQLAIGDKISIDSFNAVARETKPPPIYTDASILAAMETAGRMIENEEEREAIKECGIGTPATRANIIETLMVRAYIKREKKKLIPLDKGLALYDLLKEKKVGKADLTGQWEKKLNDMANGKYKAEQFMKEIADFTAEIVNEGLQADGTAAAAAGAAERKMP